MPSTISTARVLPSISRPALMPWMRPGQASSAATSSVPATFEAMASLTRTRFTLHSRSTAACTCWKSASVDVQVRSAFGRRGLGNDEPDEIAIETVFDVDQRGGDVHQRGVIGRCLARGHGFEAAGLFEHQLAQFAETEHAQRVADLAQHAHLRFELGRLAAATHVDVEHVLDLAQVFANRRRHGVHELHRGRRQVLAFLLDRIVDHEQLVQPERRAHRRDLGAIGGGARHVIEKIVDQLDRRVLRVTRLALRVQLQDLAIGEAQQALDRHAGLEAAFPQRFDNRAHHPPQLEHRLPRGHLLELVRDGLEDLQILFRAFAADPAHEAQLEARTQAARPLRHRHAAVRRRRGATGAACWSDLRFSSSSVPSDSSGEPRTARRSLSSGSSTSARSRPPASTRST